jgi:hypothetical protein
MIERYGDDAANERTSFRCFGRTIAPTTDIILGVELPLDVSARSGKRI